MMLRVLVAEDEKPARDKLLSQLSVIPNIEVVAIATTGKEALEMIEKEKPDLVFLDIQMPEINGIDVLVLAEFKPKVIFTTAYDQYAIQAFEKNATDYLLKPYNLERLKEAVDKVVGKPEIVDLKELKETSWLVSKDGERMFLIDPEDICFIQAEKGLLTVHYNDEIKPLNESLDKLENRLNSNYFVRLHRSYIVNLKKVKEVQSWFNGKYMVIMDDENKTQLSSSKTGAERLRKLINR